MTERLRNLRTYIFDKRHHQFRKSSADCGVLNLSERFQKNGCDDLERAVLRFKLLLEKETPVILPGEKLVFTRTIRDIPSIFTRVEWEDMKRVHYIHEKGTVSNICPNYEEILQIGLEEKKAEVLRGVVESSVAQDQVRFLTSVVQSIEAVQEFIERYARLADQMEKTETARILRSVKTNGAQTFHEALQLLRILHYMLWVSGNYHNTFGRFDQYMFPFFRNDVLSGILTKEEAFELLTEFFLSCNKDSDLYPGIQQGDNGQSLVLGGRDLSGNDQFNELSEMCLNASFDLNLIDPKINIRVHQNTPVKIYEKGSELTKKGLGFPQYSNDDVVIPGLLRLGYKEEDACNYAVAACWEFIIPGKGMDIPNIDALSLSECVLKCIPNLELSNDYPRFYETVEKEIAKTADEICKRHRQLYLEPSPFLSLLMDGTIENARDISKGGVYNNFGIHGTGIATAADSLAALKYVYFEQKEISYSDLSAALANDFKGFESLQEKLRHEVPKMGQDEDAVDLIAVDLLNSFNKALNDKKNERGGIYRAGTGTALYYINHSSNLGATPDGRSSGEVIPANYSPCLFMKQKGPVSVIRSFTKPNLQLTINGGPLTFEFDETIFHNSESISKLATLVRYYIQCGGHQIQLNAINRDQLLEARQYPDRHRNLIVRVWGWSGYFVELDEVYQNHIIARYEYGLS